MLLKLGFTDATVGDEWLELGMTTCSVTHTHTPVGIWAKNNLEVFFTRRKSPFNRELQGFKRTGHTDYKRLLGNITTPD